MTIRLHYNENTAGCSPAVLRALSALTVQEIATYDAGERTAEDIADWFGVDGRMVVPVNGLDEGILIAAQLAAFESGARFDALIVEPAFEMYQHAVRSTGGQVVRVPPERGLEFDAERVLSAATAETRLVFLCDPNNPTGLAIPGGDIERVADGLPGALIFVDEAYADFSGRTIIGSALASRPNVICGRTFAKAHGLAGLRIGALMAAAPTADRLRGLALPYRINVAAAAALRAAFSDREHFTRTIRDAAQSRELLASACKPLGWPTWPSDANFLLVRVGPAAAECAEWLEARGVRVRNRSSLPGCEGCLRITTGAPPDTRIAIALMEEWHASQSR